MKDFLAILIITTYLHLLFDIIIMMYKITKDYLSSLYHVSSKAYSKTLNLFKKILHLIVLMYLLNVLLIKFIIKINEF